MSDTGVSAPVSAWAATAIVALCVLAEFAASQSSLPGGAQIVVLVIATSAAVAVTLWGHMGIGRETRFSRSMLLSTLALSVLMVAVLALEFSARAPIGSLR